jgi:hypothetical protein
VGTLRSFGADIRTAAKPPFAARLEKR